MPNQRRRIGAFANTALSARLPQPAQPRARVRLAGPSRHAGARTAAQKRGARRTAHCVALEQPVDLHGRFELTGHGVPLGGADVTDPKDDTAQEAERHQQSFIHALHRLTSRAKMGCYLPGTQRSSSVVVPFFAAPAKASMDWGAMIAHSGPVGIFVMLSLVAMSIACWGIIILKFNQLRVAERQTQTFLDCFWNASDLEVVYQKSQTLERSPVAQQFVAGYRELGRAGAESGGSFAVELGSFENIERALQRAGLDERLELERLTSFLATTASAAPFIGLFGTVVGIIRAFQDIGLQGSANLATVAPGISEALVVTAAGLAAAIPAVIAYNYFLSRIRVLRSEMESFTRDFLNIVKRHFFS